METRRRWTVRGTVVVAVGALLFAGACDYGAGTGEGDEGGCGAEDFTGVEELAQPLTNLATPCSYATPGGVPTMTIVLADDEIGVVSKRAVDGAMLVNGHACGGALASTLKRINVTGSTGTNTIILDFANGTFAPGYGTGQGTPGVVVDLVSGANDAFKIRGYTGTDTITFGADGVAWNTDTVKDATLANVDDVVVSLGAGNDTFSGSGGYGTGNAYAGVLTVYGGDGNDTISGGTGADILNGGDGNDTLRGALDAAGDTAADTLNGDAGNDTFDCGNASNGGDVMNGGAGTDTVSYAGRTNALTVTMGAGANDGEAGENDTIAADVEVVVGGAGNDTLTGSANADTIYGGPGNDTITGGDGDDTLHGDAGDDTFVCGADADGADVFNGGAGTDTVTYAARGVGEDVTVTIDNVANDGESGELDNVKTDVENLIGGAGDDNFTGSASANVLTGGAGDDTLNGGAGDDTFLEGAADSGSDTFIGGTGTDTVDYSARTGDLTITMDGTADDGLAGELDNVGTDIENVLCGSGDDTVTGNALANLIEGGAGDDTLSGGAGNDELYGGAGDDILDGGAGDDILDGGSDTTADVLDCGPGEGDIAIFDPDETPINCEL
jgi:Ca2+-binding RTX toxin-like protein